MHLTDIGRRREDTGAVRFDGHPPHRHDRPQLIYLAVGRALVTVEEAPFTLHEGQGVWIPAGVEHALELAPDGIVLGPLLGPGGEPATREPRLVDAPVVRQLMTTLLGVDPQSPAEVSAFRSQIEHILRLTADHYFVLRLPVHPAAQAIGKAAGTSSATLAELAAEQFISPRHAQRLFVEETGLPFATWRTRARLNVAIAQLTGGHGMTRALAASGFATRGGLIKALSRECGISRDRITADPVDALSAARSARC